MPKTTEEKLKKLREQQTRQRERQKAKAIAKANCPIHQQKLKEKRLASAERSREKRLAKVNSPEYRQEKIDKANAAKARQIEKAKNKPPADPKPRKKVASKGLKGRTPTAEEKRIMNALGQLPCIACYNKGRDNPLISLPYVPCFPLYVLCPPPPHLFFHWPFPISVFNAVAL